MLTSMVRPVPFSAKTIALAANPSGISQLSPQKTAMPPSTLPNAMPAVLSSRVSLARLEQRSSR